MKLKKLSEVINDVRRACINSDIGLLRIFKCNDFGSRYLHPSQFIAWDEENNCPMEEPKKYNLVLGDKRRNPLYEKQCGNWWKAKSKVLFEGFEVVYDIGFNDTSFWIRCGDLNVGYYKSKPKYWVWNYKTIQQLENKAEVRDEVAKELYG